MWILTTADELFVLKSGINTPQLSNCVCYVENMGKQLRHMGVASFRSLFGGDSAISFILYSETNSYNPCPPSYLNL